MYSLASVVLELDLLGSMLFPVVKMKISVWYWRKLWNQIVQSWKSLMLHYDLQIIGETDVY